MALLFLQIFALFIVQLDVLRNEIQEMARRKICLLVLLSLQSVVEPMQRVVNIHHSIDNTLSVSWWKVETSEGDRNAIRSSVVRSIEINGLRKFRADLVKCL